MKKTFSKNEVPTVAQEILASLKAGGQATVLALSGDLGAGKTTLTQAIAHELGITENVISPTFVIMKLYEFPKKLGELPVTKLVHIDAYRLNAYQELERLGWAELISDPQNLILIEWPERVEEIIPESAYRISLSHKNEDEREISLS